MRSKFPGYYAPTANEFEELWKDALFVLDTNVLLDLFRYSEETVLSMIETIKKIKNRIWIPYRVSLEYHRNLNEVISTQINNYKKTIETLEEFKKQLEAKKGHPFLAKALHEEIQEFCNKFDDELIKKKNEIEKMIIENPIKEKIAVLLDKKIGDNFSEDEIKSICLDGVKRYSEKIPPGYKDCKGKQGNDVYGDLLIWNEIIKKSNKDKKHIILVTGDVKEDWFLKYVGKTIGPRPELIHEFREKTQKMFYAYPTSQFLEFSNKYFKTDIKQQVIDEVENVIISDSKNEQTSNVSDEFCSSENTTTIPLNLGEITNNQNNSQTTN